MYIGRALYTGLAALILAAVLSGCGGGGGETTTATQPQPDEQGAPGEETAPSPQGEQLFSSLGCRSCHTLAATGSKSAIGPDLDEALRGKSSAFIRESIVDPTAEVASGYSEGLMPGDFGDRLSEPELEALVSFLAQSTSGQP